MSESFNKFYLYSGIIAFIIILYLISTSSFKNGKPTCNNYVFNVYLYLAMSITLIGLFAYVINELTSKNEAEKHQLMPMNYIYNQLGSYIFGGMILSFIFIIMIAFTNNFSKTGHIYNHIIWLFFVASISIMIYPYFKSQELAGVVDDALISTALVFIFMSIIVYAQPDFFEKSYNFVMPGLIVGLLAISLRILALSSSSRPSQPFFSLSASEAVIVILLRVSPSLERISTSTSGS